MHTWWPGNTSLDLQHFLHWSPTDLVQILFDFLLPFLFFLLLSQTFPDSLLLFFNHRLCARPFFLWLQSLLPSEPAISDVVLQLLLIYVQGHHQFGSKNGRIFKEHLVQLLGPFLST